MTERNWKSIAIGEFIIITMGIMFGLFYFTYKAGMLDEGIKGVVRVLANIAYLIYILAGSTGWMLLVGCWGGLDDEWT